MGTVRPTASPTRTREFGEARHPAISAIRASKSDGRTRMDHLTSARWRARSAWGGAALVAVLGVAMSVAPAHAAEGTVLGAGRPDVLPGSYIVVLKNDTLAAQSVSASATSLAARYGGTVAATYTTALRGFSAKLSEQAARRMAADRSVAYVQQDMIMSLVDTQTNPPSWGLDRIDQRNL